MHLTNWNRWNQTFCLIESLNLNGNNGKALILRIVKAKVFPSWTLKNLVLFPILTKFVTISPLIWLCVGTNFELQKIVLGRLQFFIFDKRGVKTKTYFLSTYYIKLTKYLYISFQINLNWAKIESSTTTSILKYFIFKDFEA